VVGGNAEWKKASRLAAEQYAPAPRGSSFIYGTVGVSLVALALFAFATFYSVDLLFFPKLMGGFLALAFLGGMALQRVRKNRNSSAYRHEYNKRARSADCGNGPKEGMETKNVRVFEDPPVPTAREHSTRC
jgi:hypothetical protein